MEVPTFVRQTQGEPRVLISRAALQHNAQLIRRALIPQTKLCAVIKADAYGHGAPLVADALCNFSIDGSDRGAVDQLAVATIDEAAALPDVNVPILILRPIENVFLGRQRAALELAIRSGWVMTIDSLSAADDVARIAVNCQRRAMINVMIDTGMTRGGCDPGTLNDLLHRIEARSSLKLVGLNSHFASCDSTTDECMVDQLRRFRHATDFYATWATKVTRHLANSGAVFFSPASHFDMVRPGISLYGIDPTLRPDLNRPLKPAMRWTAPLLSVRDVPAGSGIGYSHSFVAPRDMRIGLVPVGYADGYLRAFSNKAVMMLNGAICPVVGRVSMDMTTIDVTAADHATVGDEVTLLESDPLSPASVYELAKAADTIPYEIFARIGPRVRRVAIDPADESTPTGMSAEENDAIF
jgi:alanine racemase